jgi:small subunit ribosomal protein S2
MLTNFKTTIKSIRKMSTIDKMKSDGSWETLNKREKLFKTRQREKLEKTFGSIADMTRQPAAIFIVDILKEHIALAEARRLNIPTFAMVDTNSNPKLVDFPIPANDDATKSISLILDQICNAIQEGLEDRKNLKEKDKDGSSKDETTKAVAAEEIVTEVAPVAEVVSIAKETAVVESETVESESEKIEIPVVEDAPKAPAADDKSAE